MIKTIIFDFGNVVAMFSHKKICQGLEKCSNYPAKKLHNIIFKIIYYQDPLEKLLDEGALTSEGFFQEVKARAGLRINYKRFKKIWQDIFWLNEPMVEVLEKLKRKGYKLVLLSNTNELHFRWACSQFKILKIFDELVLSFKKGYRKPDKRLWQGYGKESIYIDDVEEYCRAAEKAGIRKVFHYCAEKHEEFVNELFSFLKEE